MVVINIELWPLGNKTNKRNLGTIVISNDGTGTTHSGNYNVVLSHSGIYYGKKKEPWKTGKVKGFARSLSPYHLLLKALQATLKE